MVHVVVVGAGQAGSSCVAKLRNLGFEGAITLIGAEPTPPYQRPPLSKGYLLSEITLERMYLRPKSFYSGNAIDLTLGKKVSAVNSSTKTISVGNHDLDYDNLVLTTGSMPRRLPVAIGGDLDGVYTVRALDDVDAMEPEFADGKRVLIIGGGYIGLEAAAVAAKRGVRVTLIEMADRILQRVAAPETSNFFRALHTAHGVEVLEGVGLERLTGDGHVDGAVLSNGTVLKVDFAIVGVGIVPEIGLAKTAGCATDNGIVTNATGRTSVEGIWAAGDCASFPHGGGRIRLESVPNAIEQAEVVAENIMGADKEYVAKPWFWSDQYDVKLQIAGLNSGYDTVVTRPGDNESNVSFWYYKGDELLAVDAANEPRAYMVGKRLIEAGKSPPKALVSDPHFELKTLL